MRIKKMIVCVVVWLFGWVIGLGSDFQAGASRDAFWERFRTAVIKKDKTAVANLSQFPISMPYGMGPCETGCNSGNVTATFSIMTVTRPFVSRLPNLKLIPSVRRNLLLVVRTPPETRW